MIPFEQQKTLLALSGTTEAAYDLVAYSLRLRTWVIFVHPEPHPPHCIVQVKPDVAGRTPAWGRFYASIVSTSPN